MAKQLNLIDQNEQKTAIFDQLKWRLVEFFSERLKYHSMTPCFYQTELNFNQQQEFFKKSHQEYFLEKARPHRFFTFCLDDREAKDYLSYFAEQNHHEISLEKELDSCLQFIEETIKMFRFECRVSISYPDQIFLKKQAKDALKQFEAVLEKRKVVVEKSPYLNHSSYVSLRFSLIDTQKKIWEGPFLSLDLKTVKQKSSKKAHQLFGSFFYSIDYFIEAVVENYQGKLPLWLHPEVIRVIVLEDDYYSYGKEVQNSLQSQSIDTTLVVLETSLSSVIKEAKKSLVPYIAVVGEKEYLGHSVTIKDCFSQEVEQFATIDECVAHFVARKLRYRLGVKKTI